MIKITRREVVAAAAASALLGFPRRSTAAISKDHIEAILRRGVSSGRIAGAVAVAGTDREILFEGAAGKRTYGKEPDMSLDSVFWIASMTKTVTSIAAMQLVEQGKLGLHDPVSRLLPELATPMVLEGFGADGKPKLRPSKKAITLHHLLTHTSGFSYPMFNANNVRYAAYAGIPDFSTCKLAALQMPLAFDPGERFEYGISTDWLGQAVERKSGKRLEDYFRDHIFAPAGIKDTGFILKDDRRSRVAGMHTRQDDGSLKPIEFLMEQNPEFYMGGGGLYSTAHDYLKLTQIFLNHGRANGLSILRPETVKLMSRNQIGDLKVAMLKTAEPGLSNDAEFFPGIRKNWSYGFMLNQEIAPTGRSAGSLAWAGLSNCYFWIDQKRNLSGVILMQMLPFADGPCLQEFSDFESAIYNVAKAG